MNAPLNVYSNLNMESQYINNITGVSTGSLTATGNISASYFIGNLKGNLYAPTNANVFSLNNLNMSNQNIYNTNGVYASSLNASGAVNCASIVATGTIQGQSLVSVGGITLSETNGGGAYIDMSPGAPNSIYTQGSTQFDGQGSGVSPAFSILGYGTINLQNQCVVSYLPRMGNTLGAYFVPTTHNDMNSYQIDVFNGSGTNTSETKNSAYTSGTTVGFLSGNFTDLYENVQIIVHSTHGLGTQWTLTTNYEYTGGGFVNVNGQIYSLPATNADTTGTFYTRIMSEYALITMTVNQYNGSTHLYGNIAVSGY